MDVRWVLYMDPVGQSLTPDLVHRGPCPRCSRAARFIVISAVQRSPRMFQTCAGCQNLVDTAAASLSYFGPVHEPAKWQPPYMYS